MYIVYYFLTSSIMQSFISDTLTAILKKQDSFRDSVFILPSQRAGVFLKKELLKRIQPGFLPEIITIEQFIEQVSQIKKIDTVPLLFYFYKIYKNTEAEPVSFDQFTTWAVTAIQDFNEIDQQLVNPNDIFSYLRDIQRLKEWSIDGAIEETNLIKNNFSFLKQLGSYYTEFYTFLVQRKIGYQGILYRESTNKIAEYCTSNIHKNFILIGFNALNNAEEFLFKKMLEYKNTEIFWDIDAAFLNSNHQAGTFLRKYKSDWVHYSSNPFHSISTCFADEKNIQIIGASKNITQIKHVGEILENFSDYNNTALILADETLLPIAINSLPKKVGAVNITMGYPLKDTPTCSLFTSIFKLFLNQEKFQKTTTNTFYYKDVLRFLKHPAIFSLFINNGTNYVDVFANEIAKNNTTFISYELLDKWFNSVPEVPSGLLTNVFSPFSSAIEFFERIIQVILLLKDLANTIEKEYLFRFYTVFTQLKNLQEEFQCLRSIKIIQHFFQQLISVENISFQGEPLQGLQIMGLLETRVLDYENVIITSVNENIIPSNTTNSTFIPFDVKEAFGIPTYKEKDAIFSYHFFRLLQRAKNIYLLYNSDSDTFGGGEKSRFLLQLQQLKEGILESTISPKVITKKIEPTKVPKSPTILEALEKFAKNGISPSALTNYLYNPFQFYKQQILGIHEFDQVDESVASNTMGTIVHDTLEALYKPYEGKIIALSDIDSISKNVESLLRFYFDKHFNNSTSLTGKNRLVYEVSKRFIERFLEQERATVTHHELKIIALEKKLVTEVTFDEFNFPIRLKGTVDRIDELDGVTRIIDYKTGKVTASELKLADFTNIADDYSRNKAIQVLLYAFLFQQNTTSESPIQAGIISFKNLKSGVVKMNFSSQRNQPNYNITIERTTEFISTIKNLILEIFNPDIPFTEIIK